LKHDLDFETVSLSDFESKGSAAQECTSSVS